MKNLIVFSLFILFFSVTVGAQSNQNIFSFPISAFDVSMLNSIMSNKVQESDLVLFVTNNDNFEVSILRNENRHNSNIKSHAKCRNFVGALESTITKYLEQNQAFVISELDDMFYINYQNVVENFSSSDGEIVSNTVTYTVPSNFVDIDDEIHERKTCRIGDNHGIDCSGGDCTGSLVHGGAQFCVFCNGGPSDGGSTCIPN